MNVWWCLGSRGRWDHGLLMATFSGDLWPIPITFNEYVVEPPPEDEGTVVVVSGSLLTTHPDREKSLQAIARYPWSLCVLASDECRLFAQDRLKCGLIWRQYPTPTSQGNRNILIGWPGDTRQLMRDMPRLPLSERRLLWAFAGQGAHVVRRNMFAVLKGMGGGELHISSGFGQGLPREQYFRLLTETRIAPCPTGPVYPESLRFFEALEAGCLPVCNRHAYGQRRYDQWSLILGYEPPFPLIEQWEEFPALFDKYRDSVLLQRDANRAAAWWVGYKRKMALDMVDDVCKLSGTEGQPLVTVLMPTSPISAHPSTEIIERSIRAVRAYPELKDAEIIIMIDGVREEQSHYAPAYEEYKRRLIELCNWHPDFRGCLPLVFDEFTHQAEMARAALKLVRTPYVLYVEHDTWPEGNIPWASLFEALKEINCIMLCITMTMIPEHEYLFREYRTVAGVPLRKTLKWSQRPHLAHTEWYRWMIQRYFPLGCRTMIEDRLYGRIVDGGWGNHYKHSLWLYVPDDENIRRSRTCDGRGSDPKYPMFFG